MLASATEGVTGAIVDGEDSTPATVVAWSVDVLVAPSIAPAVGNSTRDPPWSVKIAALDAELKNVVSSERSAGRRAVGQPMTSLT